MLKKLCLPGILEVTKDHWHSAIAEIKRAEQESEGAAVCVEGSCILHQALRPHFGEIFFNVEHEGVWIDNLKRTLPLSRSAQRIIRGFDNRDETLREKLPLRIMPRARKPKKKTRKRRKAV